METELVTIKTSDGLKLSGKYNKGSKPFGVVMLHMMGETKDSYDMLAGHLSANGFHTLAFDLRGHGDSEGGDYQDYSDAQHQESVLDIDAAISFLLEKEPGMAVGLVGASIGANLAIRYIVDHPVWFLVALSPGINYRGLDAFVDLEDMNNDCPMLFVSCRDDASAYRNDHMVQTLYDTCLSKNKKIKIYEKGGHGTDILKYQPNAMLMVVDWITERING
ncbi:MAG: alpha/beta hydrolase [Acidobacteriaceae bacterium]